MEKVKEDRKTESEHEQLMGLIKRTDKENPKPEDLAEMRKLLDENDGLVKINNITKKVFDRAVQICSKSELVRELFSRQIKEKRKELGIETALPIERILIDQVVICWFRLNQMELIHTDKTYESHSTETGLYWEKRLSGAQRRFIKACETLAKVQKHLAEANLREQQAQISRGKVAVLANKILKDLT